MVRRKSIKNRALAAIVSIAMIVTMIPASFLMRTTEANAEADNNAQAMASAATTISNPRVASDKTTWDCVYFGSYPQTEIVDEASRSGCYGQPWQEDGDYEVNSSLYSQLESATFDSNGDTTIAGVKYKRIQKNDATKSFSGFSYYYNWSDSTTYHYFRYEKIKWRVLEKDGDKAMLLADKALDNQKYNYSNTSITWEKSTIRSWLNGYGSSENSDGIDYSSKNFINSAFSSSEQSAIKTAALENSSNITLETSGGEDTSDKVFLLSESDVWNTDRASSYGFVKDKNEFAKQRRAKGSTYAKAMGVFTIIDKITSGTCCWWLRSPGESTKKAVYVEYDGYIYFEGGSVDYLVYGCRPALYLDLKSSTWETAGTVDSDGNVAEPEATQKLWNTSHQFYFDNGYSSFITGKYTMTDSDFNKLCNYVRKNYSESAARITIAELAAERNSRWGGSCFGMSMSTLLDYTDQIAFNENFDKGKATMHDVSSPKINSRVQSAINYYQISQLISIVRDANKCYDRDSGTWATGLKQLVEEAKTAKPILFGYFFRLGGHAIVIKGYGGTDGSGNHKLLAYDNRYPDEDTVVLISSDYSTCVVHGDENATGIEYLSDFSVYDKIDIDGPGNDMVLSDSANSSKESINGTELHVSLGSDTEIKNASGQYINIKDGKIAESTMPITDTHGIVHSTADGTNQPAEMVITVDNSECFSFKSPEKDIKAAILNNKEYSSIDVDGADRVVFSSSEGISIMGDKATYKAYQSVDEKDFNMFSFAGTTNGDANISYACRTISVTGNEPGKINVTKYAESDTEEITFDTSKSKVTVSIPYKISEVSLAANQQYSGKAVTPKVTVKDSTGKTLTKDQDYTAKYSNNVNVGTAKVTVTGKGKYTGTITKTFTISPKGTTIKTPKGGKKAFTARWSKQTAKMSKSRISGYQLQYSLSSKFAKGNKSVAVAGYSKTSKKISKLAKKKKYYVRVRTYMKVSGKYYYSTWSKVKAVKTK